MQSYGSDALDASNLVMPLVFFVSSTDPRMLKRLDATLKGPDEGGLVSNSLTFRYDVTQLPDGHAYTYLRKGRQRKCWAVAPDSRLTPRIAQGAYQ